MLLFFVVNVANNESIAFEVPFPLFIIFRSVSETLFFLQSLDATV